MNRTLGLILLAVAFLCCACDIKAGTPATQPATRPNLIPATEVFTRGIAGYTGERMGKIITIHGTLFDAGSVKGDRQFIDVDAVDGRQLSKVVRLDLVMDLHEFDRLKNSSRQLVLRGYETGYFAGIVDDPIARQFAPQDTGFGFRTHFVFMEVVAEKMDHRSADEEDRRPVDLIPVAEVYSRGIAGFTGEEVGKVITIHGTVLEQNNVLIEVDQVNGRPLTKTVRVNVGRSNLNVYSSQKVTLRGYETGGYQGSVNDLRSWELRGGGETRFGFSMRFVSLDIMAK